MSTYGYDSVGNVPTFYEGPYCTGHNKAVVHARINWLHRRLRTHRSLWAGWLERGVLTRF